MRSFLLSVRNDHQQRSASLIPLPPLFTSRTPLRAGDLTCSLKSGILCRRRASAKQWDQDLLLCGGRKGDEMIPAGGGQHRGAAAYWDMLGEQQRAS